VPASAHAIDRPLHSLGRDASYPEVRGERAVSLYRLVGWPGFAGGFSGLAPGRFAVTLNAVFSNDPVEVATPITFLIRRSWRPAVHTMRR
jgi:hypothetical protein